MMKAGFTLAELLIVIAIMGLLMVALAPLLRGNQEQALLSRQADLVRQTFYETVMKAKTGAAEAGLEQAQPLRGFLISKAGKEVRSLVIKNLSFAEAQKQGIAALLQQAIERPNLLSNEAGYDTGSVSALVSSLSLDNTEGRQVERLLVLLEPVSNEVAILTDNGALQPVPKEIGVTLTSTLAPLVQRNMVLIPGIGVMNLSQ